MQTNPKTKKRQCSCPMTSQQSASKGIPVSTPVTIEDKIEEAETIWREHGSILMEDLHLRSALKELEAAIEESWCLMRRLNVVESCSICATEVSKGGCCGAGIEDWYDSHVLLINLMLGQEIPQNRIDENGCLFLGPKGCMLKARFHFCINYLCHHIKQKLSERDLRLLKAQNGREIYSGWMVENIIREKLAEIHKGSR